MGYMSTQAAEKELVYAKRDSRLFSARGVIKMDDLDFEFLRSNIRKERIRCEMTQEQLANQVDTVTSYISDIETGKKKPSVKMLYAISVALGTGIDRLIFGNDHYHTDSLTKEVMPIFEAADEKKRSFLLMALSDLSKDYDKCIH